MAGDLTALVRNQAGVKWNYSVPARWLLPGNARALRSFSYQPVISFYLL
jgi:hypothetical protein